MDLVGDLQNIYANRWPLERFAMAVRYPGLFNGGHLAVRPGLTAPCPIIRSIGQGCHVANPRPSGMKLRSGKIRQYYFLIHHAGAGIKSENRPYGA